MKAKGIAKGKMGKTAEIRDQRTENQTPSRLGDESCAQKLGRKGVKCVSVEYGCAEVIERKEVR